MIAPCSSGVIRDQKQRENRIETNDFFPPLHTGSGLPARLPTRLPARLPARCLMYFFSMHGFCCTFPNCIEKMCEHTTRLIDGLPFMHTTTLHFAQGCVQFCQFLKFYTHIFIHFLYRKLLQAILVFAFSVADTFGLL